MGGLLAVSRGAAEEPRFVILEHRGGKKGEKPVVLVGKGVTFDSGGISIKPSDKMGDMKWDMMGAATACGAVLAAAELGLPVNVVALAPLTENMPSGSAYKPGDVVTFRNGKTAEIDNTDAEGRVVLADALDYAKEFSPSVDRRLRHAHGRGRRRPRPRGVGPLHRPRGPRRRADLRGRADRRAALAPSALGRLQGEPPLRLGRLQEHRRPLRRLHQRRDLPEGVRRPEDPVGARRHRSDGLLRARARRLRDRRDGDRPRDDAPLAEGPRLPVRPCSAPSASGTSPSSRTSTSRSTPA